jgi:hypothetical protein
VVTAFALVGCSVEELAVRQTIPLLVRTRPSIAMESDVELARAATPPGLKQLEGFYRVAGPEPRLVALLTEAFCGYGAGFLQDDWEAAVLRGARDDAEVLRRHARAVLGRCAAYAMIGLGGRYDAILALDDDAAAARLAAAGVRDAAGLYWIATATATAIGMDPLDPRLAALLPRAIAMLERVIVLAPALEQGQALMTLGILHAAQSAAIGGDPERGRALLERASAVGGGRLLLPRVMLARIYAVTVRDQALFTRTLVEVLRTDPAIAPEQRLANEIAHKKARRYLRYRARWF